jgi:hypothetical protein
MGDNTTPQPQSDGTAKTNPKRNNNPNNKTKQNNNPQTQGKPGSPDANNKGGKKYNNGAGNKNQRGKPKPSPEAQKKINEIRQATSNYYSEADIFNVLQQQNFDQERAFQILKDKRQNSWSAVVKKVQPMSSTLPAASPNTVPAPAPSSPVATPNTATNAADQKAETEKKATPNNKTQTKKQKKAEKQATAQQQEPAPAPEPEKVVSADAKIADLEEQVAKDLSVIESKAQHLKNLREELRSVKAERDAQIQSLQTEKTTLLERREQLEKELTQIKERVVEIDKNVTTLQKEKDQKIKVLEEKYNKAIKDQ